jgi:protein-tyrosine phosphatase
MDIPGLPNFRDLGGHRTSHGTVIAPGALFRSVDLSRLEPAGGQTLGDLGIRRVVDLRTSAEVEKRPDRLPERMSSRHLDVLADAGRGGVLFHCTTGKDRTGWAAASLMLLLGVDEDAVTEDYLRTNADLLPAMQPVLDRFAGQGGDPDVLLPVLGVREEYLRTALDEVGVRFGGIRGYATDGLGLTEQDLDRLAAAVTVDA